MSQGYITELKALGSLTLLENTNLMLLCFLWQMHLLSSKVMVIKKIKITSVY